MRLIKAQTNFFEYLVTAVLYDRLFIFLIFVIVVCDFMKDQD